MLMPPTLIGRFYIKFYFSHCNSSNLFFFKIVLALLGLLYFHINFQLNLGMFTEAEPEPSYESSLFWKGTNFPQRDATIPSLCSPQELFSVVLQAPILLSLVPSGAIEHRQSLEDIQGVCIVPFPQQSTSALYSKIELFPSVQIPNVSSIS